MIKYKLTEHSISRLVGLLAGIPLNPENRDYQQFLQDVKKEGLSIVEGADVVEPDYVALRTGADGYVPITEQLDILTKDGLESLQELNNTVKTRFPKTITGGITIADVPDWVQEEADKVTLVDTV
jgi:3-keto-L-gulonate-6-phosphate decarboxylase